ncbi:TRAP transporter substrate-binding protein [Aeromicrobium camelliae]|uniref:TRAP transporter substrate-binding protein n=1 Tax=Aeromicrobium camelliae TaxID=1538144 RepID=A0A3N6YHQ5_9ACTN|nr:TRAP transporter substrate-binding protein [Aeromicrobium camelliae]RQN09324.1 TRAP transporter substrate-binding protein [Aeromicrobium camelliae]
MTTHPRRAALAITAVASAALVSACSFGTGAASDGPVTLKLAHVFPESSAVHTAATALAERAPEVTDGRVKFDVYPGSQLGGDEELGAGLASGDVECAFFAATASGLDDRLQLSLLPFIATTYEAVDEIFFDPEGVLQTNEREALEETGITALGFYENDFRGLTNNSRPIETPEDMAGMSFRVPGLSMYTKLFEAWDAKPVAIPFPELYTALQQGTVDGQDNGVVLTYNSRFQEVQKHLTLTRHAYGMGNISCNTGVWESLSEEDREALSEVIDEITADATQEVRDSVAERLNELKEDGVQVVELSDTQRAAFAAIKDEVWASQESVFGADTLDQLRKESQAATEATGE